MKGIQQLLLSFSISLTATAAMAKDFLPANIMTMDHRYSHHVGIVEKSTHRLFLYEMKDNIPTLIKTYPVATGKITGNKIVQGDRKTPEGVYSLEEFIPGRTLVERYGKEGEIYGIGAFVMNYPNFIDKAKGKTGSGIWLHSTNDNSRINKGLDSRGCVVVNDLNLVDISKYIELKKTTLIVEQDINFVSRKTWETNKSELEETVRNWITAWGNENIQDYLSYYHKKEYRDGFRKSFNQFASYKKRVFGYAGKPEIAIEDLSILKTHDYAVVKFTQKYNSNNITDVGTKTLYLKRNASYHWKIVNESWSKLPDDAHKENVAFTPSVRFFKTEKLAQETERTNDLTMNN